MPGEARIRIWDVEHGACVMIQHVAYTLGGMVGGRLAMIDSGSSSTFRPSSYIKEHMGRHRLDYLFITNADQDHMSDLQGLWDAGIYTHVLHRNPTYTGEQMRAIKRQSGPLTNDAERYVRSCQVFNLPVNEPFNQHMGGINVSMFWNSYPTFTDTNDLSLAIFVKYAGCKFLFPGDIEKPGWRALLQRADFRAELQYTDVLMASHHGRESGFCADVFDNVKPQAIVISDKAKKHQSQETVPNYRQITTDLGIPVRNIGKNRHVLTTRRDGWIQFTVNDNGRFFTDTEYHG